MSTDSSVSDFVRPSRERVLADVKQIVAEHTPVAVEEIREDHALEADLLFDSLERVEALMEAEDHFDITVPDDAAEKVRTVGDMVDGILRLLGQG